MLRNLPLKITHLKVHVNGISWGVMYAEEEFSEVFLNVRN